MHRALLIHEVVAHIAEDIGTNNDQTLLAMSLVCRAFFDPAMDVRWRVLSDVHHVIQVLPEDVFDSFEEDEDEEEDCEEDENEEEYHEQNEVAFMRPPSEVEWQRLAQYARRVQILDCQSDDVSDFMSPFLDLIVEHFPYGQLFPKLHTLRSDSLVPSALLLQFPLRRLKLKNIPSYCMEDIINALSGCASTLETIWMDQMTCLSYSNSDHHLFQTFASTFLQMEKLTAVYVPLPFPLRVVQHMSTLSALRELYLHNFTALDTVALRFPAMTRLMFRVQTVNIHALPPFFRNLDAPALQELSIYPQFEFAMRKNPANSVRPLAGSLQNVLQAISHFSTLRSFFFDPIFHTCEPPIVDAHILDGQMLAPLFPMRGLKTLELITWPVCLTEADTEAMALAWPQLRTLRLEYNTSEMAPAAADRLLPIDAVLPFARLCPKLHELRLPLRITQAPLRMPAPPTLVAKGVNLSVHRIQPDLADDVVRLLARLCRDVWAVGSGNREAAKALRKRMKEVRRAGQGAECHGEEMWSGSESD